MVEAVSVGIIAIARSVSRTEGAARLERSKCLSYLGRGKEDAADALNSRPIKIVIDLSDALFENI